MFISLYPILFFLFEIIHFKIADQRISLYLYSQKIIIQATFQKYQKKLQNTSDQFVRGFINDVNWNAD